MKFRPVKIVKSTAKSFIDVKSWIGLQSLKEGAGVIKDAGKSLFEKENYAAETFEQAMVRFNLSEADLQRKAAFLMQQVWIYLGLSLLLFAYGLFLFLIGKASLGIIVLGIVVLAVCKAYRAHFYVYEISQRRLGCTFREWRTHLFKDLANGGKE